MKCAAVDFKWCLNLPAVLSVRRGFHAPPASSSCCCCFSLLLLLSIVSHARLLCYCFRALSLRPQPYSIVSLTLGFKRPLQRSKCHEFFTISLVVFSVCFFFVLSFVSFCTRLCRSILVSGFFLRVFFLILVTRFVERKLKI